MPEREKQDLDEAVKRRTFWRGTLTFGLVSIPVNLLVADHSDRVALRMVSPEGHPLRRRYYASSDDRPLDNGEIVRGYEVEKGSYVILSDDELERLAPERTRDINLQTFVPTDRIDPMLFERAYYLVPDGKSTTAYRLLAAIMEEMGRAAVATFVMRTKEYLVAILAEGGILRAETLRFADEVRTPESLGLPQSTKPSAAEVEGMRKAIAELASARLDPRELVDQSAERLRKLAEKKARSRKSVIDVRDDVEEEGPSVSDIFALLRKSVSARVAAEPAAGASDAGLDEKSREELYEQAKKLNIPGRSSMSKEELIRAIRRMRAA